MEVIWSQAALQHLRAIAEYVADNFGQGTAVKTVERIQKKANTLATFPERGLLDRKYSTREYSVRHFKIAPNVVYYILYPNTIVIAVIAYTKQSPQTVDRILNNFLEHYEM